MVDLGQKGWTTVHPFSFLNGLLDNQYSVLIIKNKLMTKYTLLLQKTWFYKNDETSEK